MFYKLDMYISIYFESWASQWTSVASAMDLANVDSNVNIVYLAFADPMTKYVAGSKKFDGTGLEFSQDFAVVSGAISILEKKGIKVILSVGGASYSYTGPVGAFANYSNVCNLAKDLGCMGIDIDMEPGNNLPVNGMFGPAINAFRSACKTAGLTFLSAAIPGNGAHPSIPSGDLYTGCAHAGLVQYGGELNVVNIMSYDYGAPTPTMNNVTMFNEFRNAYKGCLCIGLETGKQGWGNYEITQHDVQSSCDRAKVDENSGIFVWSWFGGQKTSPSVSQIIATAKSTFSK